MVIFKATRRIVSNIPYIMEQDGYQTEKMIHGITEGHKSC